MNFSDNYNRQYFNNCSNIIKKSKIKMAKQKKTANNPIIPLFLQKLCSILQDQTCFEYINWTSTEDSFIIKDINRFTDIVLPKYFKHSNFSSFIRQLNMYGFNKIRHDQGQNVYKNDNFKRDSRHLLKNIKRKINQNQKEDKLVLYEPGNSLNKQLKDLKVRQKNLQGMCRQLIAQNNKILEENNRMMKKLSEGQKQKNSKMEQLLVSLIMARGNQISLPGFEDGNMLSLTNQETNNGAAQVNSLEAFRQFLDDHDGVSKLQQALKNLQSEERKKSKSKNYTIVQPHISLQAPQNQEIQHQSFNLKHADNQMLSLSDFLNIESPHQDPLL